VEDLKSVAVAECNLSLTGPISGLFPPGASSLQSSVSSNTCFKYYEDATLLADISIPLNSVQGDISRVESILTWPVSDIGVLALAGYILPWSSQIFVEPCKQADQPLSDEWES
jgi:hypothetical protein